MYLVLLTYLVEESKILPLRQQHYAFVDRYFESGVFLLGGRRVPATGGFILARGVSEEQLMSIMAEDPYLAAGLVEHSLIALEPTRSQPEFARAVGLPVD